MPRYKIFFLDQLSCYLNSLGDALCQRGNQLYYQPSWNWEEIERGIAYFKPDILITVGSDLPLRSQEIAILPEICRKYDLLHIYWATEDKIHFESWTLPYIQKVKPDLIWTIHPDCLREYKALGIEAAYFNFAFNPRMFPQKPFSPIESYDISFIGTTHLERKTYRYVSLQQLVFPLIRRNTKVNIWGFNWLEELPFINKQFDVNIPAEWLHGYLPFKETAIIYHQSKVLLGVQNALDQVTQRTFEIMGTGAFMIASKTEELSRLFTDGQDVVLSTGPEHTLDLVDYYLLHPAKRYEIGQKAREKILSTHTFDHRFAHIWPHLEQFIQKKRKMNGRKERNL